jgi:hypothetical protein
MRILLILLGLAVALPGQAKAQYTVYPSVFAGGGARMTGGAYVVTGTTGQSSPVGISTGGTYQTHHGFWHAAGGGGGALNPMVLSIVLLNPTAARLSWAAVTGATFYDLYRSTTPFFNPSGAAWQTIASPTVQYDFSAGVGNEATNYFFRGIARNASQTAPASNTVGEFDFGADIPLMGRAGDSGTAAGEER